MRDRSSSVIRNTAHVRSRCRDNTSRGFREIGPTPNIVATKILLLRVRNTLTHTVVAVKKCKIISYRRRLPPLSAIASVTKPIFHASRHAPAIADVTMHTYYTTAQPATPHAPPLNFPPLVDKTTVQQPTVMKMYNGGGGLIGV